MRSEEKVFEVYPPKTKIDIYGECHDEDEELRKAYIKGCHDTVAEIMSDTIKRTELPTSLEEAAEKAGLEYAPIIAGESLDLSGQFYETDDVHWPSRCGFINGFRAGAEWMKAKMNWHSVEECLPEMDEEVIVLADRLNLGSLFAIAIGHIVDKEKAVDYNGWNIPGVKFWMPMPKIPEEKI